MNKITIKNGNKKYDITINRVKYVFSSNQDEFKIKQSFLEAKVNLEKKTVILIKYYLMIKI